MKVLGVIGLAAGLLLVPAAAWAQKPPPPATGKAPPSPPPVADTPMPDILDDAGQTCGHFLVEGNNDAEEFLTGEGWEIEAYRTLDGPFAWDRSAYKPAAGDGETYLYVTFETYRQTVIGACYYDTEFAGGIVDLRHVDGELDTVGDIRVLDDGSMYGVWEGTAAQDVPYFLFASSTPDLFRFQVRWTRSLP